MLAVLFSGCGGSGGQNLATCGNGHLDSGEGCDDGNLIDSDACSSLCQAARCGDGLVYIGVEDCEGSELNNGTCAVIGRLGKPDCDASCHFDYSTCGELIPATSTPTITATPAATFTPAPPTPTPTPTPASRCGDGLLSNDETCESCPADCTPLACDPSGATTAVSVTFSPPIGTQPAQVRLLLAYRTSVISLPSAGLLARFQPDQTGLILRPTAKQYAVDVAAARTGGVADGPLFTVTFDLCAGAAPPTGSDLACTVTSCPGASGCNCTAAVQ